MRIFVIALLVVTSLAVPASAQQFGGAENMAPNIPTPQILVERMLEVAEVSPSDVVYDLGSGDGRIVIILDMGSLVRSEWRAKTTEAAVLDQRDRRTFALVVDDSITVRRVSVVVPCLA